MLLRLTAAPCARRIVPAHYHGGGQFRAAAFIPRLYRAAPSECCEVRASPILVTPRAGVVVGIGLKMNRPDASATFATATPAAATAQPALLVRFQPYILSILRIMAGLLFCEHGLSKLF